MAYLKRLLSKLAGFLGFRAGRKIALEKIWKIELVVAAVLLLVVLSFDVWVYRTFVSGIQETALPKDAEGFVFLDKINLEKASDKVTAHERFLNSPSYPPLINDPF